MSDESDTTSSQDDGPDVDERKVDEGEMVREERDEEENVEDTYGG